jgi:hypothetical protein
MNENFNSVKMHGIKSVKITGKAFKVLKELNTEEERHSGTSPLNNTHGYMHRPKQK